MNGTRLLRNSNLQATSDTQAVVNFLYRGMQLPASLTQYAGLFTGLFTGALGGFALHAYFQRNKCDKAKLKLSVHHILRVIQMDYSYKAWLQDPQELLKHIETEVMRLVDKHVTQSEAAQVTKAVKRNFFKMDISFDKVVHKRVREDFRDVVKERQGPALAAAYEEPLRGFLPPTEPEMPYQEYVLGPVRDSKVKYESSFDALERCGSLLEPDDDSVDAELGLGEDEMVIDEDVPSSGIPHVPYHLFDSSARPAARLLAAPEPADMRTRNAEGLQVAALVKSVRHAPEFGSFGLDYDDEDLYSDTSEGF